MNISSIRSGMVLFLGAIGLATSAISQESYCTKRSEPTTPTRAFVDQGDGVVTHIETGLQWSRCAIGQQFNGSECEGQAQVFHWGETATAVAQINDRGSLGGHGDWRVPTLTELLTIVEKCREAPALNPEIFPNTPWTGFWSATPNREAHEPQAWFVGFYKGLEYPFDVYASYRVRPVRSAN